MPRPNSSGSIDMFQQFYRDYYHSEINDLVDKYPDKQRSLYVDWEDFHKFDPDMADDFIAQPDAMGDLAEEALRLYDHSGDVALGQAHVRLQNLSNTTSIRELGAAHNGELVAVRGIVQKSTDVQVQIDEAAFECQRCGTLTRIPQTTTEYLEPHKCQGCERDGPFDISFHQSEFIDHQEVHLLEDPSILPSGTQPERLEVHLEYDLAGKAVAGDTVQMAGVVHFEQQGTDNHKSATFELFLKGHSILTTSSSELPGRQELPTGIPDLDTYVDCASTALSTLPADVREEETKAKLITPFVEALGWYKYDGTEVRLEYTDSKTDHRADYALFGPQSDTPDIIIEAKQLDTHLESKEDQITTYMRVFTAGWGVLTDGKQFYIYQLVDGVPHRLTEIELGELPESDIVDSLSRRAF